MWEFGGIIMTDYVYYAKTMFLDNDKVVIWFPDIPELVIPFDKKQFEHQYDYVLRYLKDILAYTLIDYMNHFNMPVPAPRQTKGIPIRVTDGDIEELLNL